MGKAKGFVGSQKWCFVPNCKNTSRRTSRKTFFCVPKDIERRRRWAKAVGRKNAGSITSRNPWFCCMDHFEVDDYSNYLRVQLMGGQLRLKKEAIPKADPMVELDEEETRPFSPIIIFAELGDNTGELEALRSELAQLRDENRSAQTESERLLHLMQMSQEEQFAKDKTIKELQDALKRSRSASLIAPASAGPSRATTPGGAGSGNPGHPLSQPPPQNKPQLPNLLPDAAGNAATAAANVAGNVAGNAANASKAVGGFLKSLF